jgi:predicted MPP superfamily phosphohydrolase
MVVGGVAGAGVAIDGAFVTPSRLVESRHAFATPRSRPGAAPDVSLRIAQVSDLHLEAIGPLERQLLEKLHEARADVIAFTGDMIDQPGSIGLLDTFLGECPARPRRVAIPGNWEYWSGVPLEEHRRVHERHGAEWLVNRSILVSHGTRQLRVTGLDDLRGGHPDATAAVADAAPADAHLLLLHCPVLRDLPSAAIPADLALAGHTHGGQVAPLGWAPVRPTGSGRYVAGWYRDGALPMYVSRGIGTSGLPVRIGATPELVIIDWSLG